MAIVDGYVMAMRLAATKLQTVETTLQEYDSPARRKSNNKVIREARAYGRYAVSTHPVTRWCFRMVLKYMPASMLTSELTKGDESNREFVKAMDEAIKGM